jgi:hypothetical protein
VAAPGGRWQVENVLNSDLAIRMGIMVVRAFVAISGLTLSLPNIEKSVRDAHARLDSHDQVIDAVVGTLKSLSTEDGKRRRRKSASNSRFGNRVSPYPRCN